MEVSGTTKKLKKKKQGTGGPELVMKSPVFIGGGRIFGRSVPRDYSFLS